MASFYEMPAISPTMEVGTLVTWRVAEGEAFTPQTVLAEVGTDKANMDAEVFDDGVLLKHLIAEGDEVPPGFPIAVVGASAGEDISALLAEFEVRKASLGAPVPVPVPVPVPEAPAPVAAPAPTPVVEAPKAREWMGRPIPAVFQDPPGDLRVGRGVRRVVASPLARAVAADLGIDVSRVRGSGPGGRIVRADVEGAPAAKGPVAPPPADEVVRNSPMRKTIAKRLLASHQDIPTFYLTASFAADRLVELRAQLKDAGVGASYNDLTVAAVGRALRAYPRANATWSDQAITRRGGVHVGVAVALDDGLITPIVRDADKKPIADIAAEIRDLAGRAKEGKLREDEYVGATFTVSNLGMFGIDHFTAIINPPEAAILAVGALRQEPVVEGGAVAVRWRLTATMTCDHRVIDGATGAKFLQELRGFLENPVRLLL